MYIAKNTTSIPHGKRKNIQKINDDIIRRKNEDITRHYRSTALVDPIKSFCVQLNDTH